MTHSLLHFTETIKLTLKKTMKNTMTAAAAAAPADSVHRKPALGWLNPLLYSWQQTQQTPQTQHNTQHNTQQTETETGGAAAAFNDVTKGSNPGCAVDASVGYLGTGFEATIG